MPRRGPYAPIFNPGIRKGHINPGVAVGEPPVTYPFIVSSLTDALLDGAFGVAVDGNYAYVTAYNQDRLVVVDISDPANMTIVGSVSNATTLNGPAGVTKSGNYCYVAAQGGATGRLTVVDVATPASPSISGSVANAVLNQCFGVAHSGTTAYVSAISADRLAVVDASTPATPTISGSVTDALLDGAWGVVKLPSDHVLVSSINDDCVVVIDVSTPSTPTLVESLVDTTDLNGARGMVLIGSDLYVCASDGASGGRLVPMDVSSPTAITKGTATQLTHRPVACAVGADGNIYVTPLNGGHVTQVSATDPPVEGVILTDAAFGTSSDMMIAAGGSFMFVTSFDADSLTSIQVAA